jgi:hypothetical protein
MHLTCAWCALALLKAPFSDFTVPVPADSGGLYISQPPSTVMRAFWLLFKMECSRPPFALMFCPTMVFAPFASCQLTRKEPCRVFACTSGGNMQLDVLT